MSKVMIIGAGGVGGVVAHKCAPQSPTFSRRSCWPAAPSPSARPLPRDQGALRPDYRDRARSTPTTSPQTGRADQASTSPTLVINVALPYQDLPHHGRLPARPASTTSTPPTTSRATSPSSSTSGSGPTRSASRRPGCMALLGSGFDPGRHQRLTAPTRRSTCSTRSTTIDIVDCNAGSHGKAFATNFNPEINIREVTAARPLLGERRVEGDRPAQRCRGSSTSRASGR